MQLALPESGDLVVLAFHLGDELFGIDATLVQEVSRSIAPTRVPGAPSVVRGIVNLRSRILLVLDPPVALGLPPAPESPEQRLIILRSAVAENTALLVDRCEDLLRVPRDRIDDRQVQDAASEALPDATGLSPVTAVCRLDTRLLNLIDPKRLIAAAERLSCTA